MTNTPQPARSHRGQLIPLAILVTVLSVPIVLGWINTSANDDPPPSLCDMLRAGWTVDELADSDHWRAWPASMSRTERGFTVLRAAGRECPDLVGR